MCKEMGGSSALQQMLPPGEFEMRKLVFCWDYFNTFFVVPSAFWMMLTPFFMLFITRPPRS